MMEGYTTKCGHCRVDIVLDFGSLFLIMFDDCVTGDVFRFICPKCMEFNEKLADKPTIKMFIKTTPDYCRVVSDRAITECEIEDFVNKL